MNTKEFKIQELKFNDVNKTLQLLKQLNPNKSIENLKKTISLMFSFNNYMCLGLYDNGKLIGLTSSWTSVRVYSGKQLELDNVIIDNKLQSKGFGEIFISLIEKWAIKNDYETVELHTYIENSRSHKFYFKQNFKILGFHFQKQLKNN